MRLSLVSQENNDTIAYPLPLPNELYFSLKHYHSAC